MFGKPLSEWIRDLKYGAWFEAKRAAEIVGRLGPDAKTAVPALIKGLDHEEARIACIQALGHVGPLAKRAARKLRSYRRSKDPRVRLHSLEALDRIGIDIVPLLMKDLREPAFRVSAIHDLGVLGERSLPAVPNLVAILGHVVKPLPRGLHRADVRQRHAQKMQAAVVCRRTAAIAVGRIGDGSWRTIQGLGERLEDPDAEVRRQSVIALARQGAAAAPVMSRALRLPDDEIVSALVRVLHSYGPDAKESLKELRKVARSAKRPRARGLAGPAYLAIERSLQTLEAAMNGTGAARRQALVDLCGFGDGVAPLVAEALANADLETRRALLDALLARQDLFRTARTPYSITRLPAPRMPLDVLLPVLIKLLGHEDARLAASSATAIGSLGRRAKSAASTLARCLQRRSPELRLAAIAALGSMGRDAGLATPQLFDALRDARLRDAAARTLVQIGRNAVPVLLRALDEADTEAQQAAIGALGAIGPIAWRALVPLRTLAESGREPLRTLAAQAAARIDPE